jgi:hypothetical protein
MNRGCLCTNIRVYTYNHSLIAHAYFHELFNYVYIYIIGLWYGGERGLEKVNFRFLDIALCSHKDKPYWWRWSALNIVGRFSILECLVYCYICLPVIRVECSMGVTDMKRSKVPLSSWTLEDLLWLWGQEIHIHRKEMRRRDLFERYVSKNGGRSVGIVRLRTKGHGVCFLWVRISTMTYKNGFV